MACEINASPSNGLVQSADGSGVIKLKSDGKTTNALAWVNFNGTGTVAIRSSYNVSSITDNGTGDYTVNFATALSDANYVCLATASFSAGWQMAVGFNSNGIKTTTAQQLVTYNVLAASFIYTDSPSVEVSIFGN
jgi:hypothetical protein